MILRRSMIAGRWRDPVPEHLRPGTASRGPRRREKQHRYVAPEGGSPALTGATMIRLTILALALIAVAPIAADAQTTVPPPEPRSCVSDCTRKQTNATPGWPAAISASSPGCSRSVTVIRNDYNRATAGDRNVEFFTPAVRDLPGAAPSISAALERL